jgi:hypothetical protein
MPFVLVDVDGASLERFAEPRAVRAYLRARIQEEPSFVEDLAVLEYRAGSRIGDPVLAEDFLEGPDVVGSQILEWLRGRSVATAAIHVGVTGAQDVVRHVVIRAPVDQTILRSAFGPAGRHHGDRVLDRSLSSVA